MHHFNKEIFMTTLPVIDYYYSFLKKSSGTWTDFSGMAFEKFEQLNDLNIKHTKSSMTDTSEAIAAMLESLENFQNVSDHDLVLT